MAPSPDDEDRFRVDPVGSVTPDRKDADGSLGGILLDRRSLVAMGLGLALTGCLRPAAVWHPGPVRDPSRPTGVTYTVQSGDTLSGISRRTGLSVRDLMTTNRLGSTNLVPGQRLWLPGIAVVAYDPLGQAQVARAPAPTADWPRGYMVIPRSRWTSVPIGKNHYSMDRITRITVHHTSEYAGMATLTDLEVVRRIDQYHRTGRKWASIGYHYLIGRDGRIYQGRPESIQGAHTSGANKNNLGISALGDHHRSLPNRAQLVALRNFLEDTRQRLKISKSRTYGHRDLSNSTCPGDRLYGWLQSYKNS